MEEHHHHAHDHHKHYNPEQEVIKEKNKLAEKTVHAHEEAEPHHEHRHQTPGNLSHQDHHRMMIKDFKKRFWISLILAIPVMLFSPMLQHIIGFHIDFLFMEYAAFVISTVIYFYGGWPFLKGFYDEVKAGSPGMMTLIAVAISVAYIYSTAVVFGLEGMDFFWELATLIVIMLLGHWIEMRSVLGASRSLEMLVNMMPSEANLIKDGEVVKVNIKHIKKGDILLIKPGEKVPADGMVVEGESYLDESMLTGESVPVKKEKDTKAIGGSVNGNGSLQIKVENTGEESYLNKVINLVQQAQQSKSKTQHLADKAAKWLTFIALGAGFLTLIIWLLMGHSFDYALERMVTVMVISCPHALGLAIPLVVAISTSVSAKNGLLIRNRTAFENARKITTIIFDKTGTLTKGSHEVSEVVSFGDFSQYELLRLAAGVEQHSEHYIAQGILKKVKAEKMLIPASTDFEYLPGKGLAGVVEGKNIKVVGPNYIKEMQLEIPASEADEQIASVVYVIVNDKPEGYISMQDQVRPESAEAIEILHNSGIKTLLLTGDNERVAKKVSKELGMEGYFANVLPHEKQEKVKELQQKGEFVAMTGDGVNDAPALAQADVGIAVGSGTDVAAETADIILVNSNPKDIANLILFGKKTYRKMIQNLIWATGYNAFAIPLAAGVLFSIGIVLDPAIGAVLMSLSTVIVALNAQLLRRSMKR